VPEIKLEVLPVREGVANFGITVRELTPGLREQLNVPGEIRGVVVTGVVPASAAAEAGVSPGDVIIEINRKNVQSLDVFSSIMSGIPLEEPLVILVKRGGKGYYLTVSPMM